MSDEQNKGPLISITGLAIILAALGLTVFTQEPYTGLRPSLSGFHETREKVPARLWQDPFRAVKSHLEGENADKNWERKLIDLSDQRKNSPENYLTETIRQKIAEQVDLTKVTITVLGVMVFGEAYAEDMEKRIRYRNALLAGLHKLEFEPEDAEHIEYMMVQTSLSPIQSLSSKQTDKDTQKRKKAKDAHLDQIKLLGSSTPNFDIMPFEWFVRRSNNPKERDYVLLLWLSEEIFKKESDRTPGKPDPLLKLGYLKRSIDAVDTPSAIPRPHEIQFKIIGPASSGLLQDMLMEIHASEPLPATPMRKEENMANMPMTSGEGELKTKTEIVDALNVIGTLTVKSMKLTGAEILNRMTIELKTKESSRLNQDSARDWDPLRLGDMQFNLLSATATIDDGILLESMGERSQREPQENYASIQVKFRRYGITFQHTINSDRVLALKLLEELHLRNFNFKKDHIILISEWDTLYGRGLSDIYRQVLMEDISKRLIDTQLHRYSYLRGIDGVIPGQRKSTKEDSTAEKSSTDDRQMVKNLDEVLGKSEESQKIEFAYGKGQKDYLRRLSDEVYAIDQELKNDGRGIKAIGVLGNDYFDKSLVLQAFKKRFPQAIFFTSDLDARMMHPANIGYTRNLVVASSYGFTLRNDEEKNLQGDAQPFRDCYQTALYYTTLRIFNFFNDMDNRLPPPLVFEIGRSKAFLLTQQADTDNNNSKDKISSYEVQPRRTDIEFHKKTFLKAIVALVLAILLLYLTIPWITLYLNKFFENMKIMGCKKWGPTKIVLGILILGGIGFSFYHFILMNPDEEPFSIFEGISIWPTEILRLLAFVLSMVYIKRSNEMLQDNAMEIEHEFKDISDGLSPGNGVIKDPRDKQNPTSSGTIQENKSAWVKKKWLLVRTSLARATFNLASEEKIASIREIWNDYLKRHTWSYMRYWFVPMFFGYIALCFTIILFSGIPSRPLRGTITSFLDIIFLVLNIVSFVSLLLLVFYHTRICSQFIAMAKEKVAQAVDDYEWFKAIIPSLGPANETSNSPSCSKSMVLSYWGLVHLIAKRTEGVGQLIFYPFIIVFIIVLSRYRYFDDLYTPPGLAVVILLSTVLAWCCGYRLRREAEGLRKVTLHHLDMRKNLILSQKEPDTSSLKHLEETMNSIRTNQDGAFAPFSQHPLMRALIAPFGGAGALLFIDFLNKLNF